MKKIWVLSLLRVGDLLQHRSLLRSLRSLYPSHQINLLINESVFQLGVKVSEADAVFAFPRESLQRILASNERSIHEAVMELENWMRDLNPQAEDLVFNFTHTRLASLLVSLFPCQEKRGPQWSPKGKPLARTWKEMEWERGVGGHWIELAASALRLPIPERIEAMQVSSVLRLGLQIFTSDLKKDWSLQNWWSLAALLGESFPELEVSFLVAPFEVEKLTDAQKYDPRLRVLRWSELEKFVSGLDLLVSGDTSVLHLAVEKGVRSLGLYMGSAQALSSGPYQKDPWVLQASSSCFPCGASSACGQTRHWCGESIKVESVFNELLKSIEGRKNANRIVQSTDPTSPVQSSANHPAL